MTWFAEMGGTAVDREEEVVAALLEAEWYFSGMGGGGGMAVDGVGGILRIPWVVGLMG